MATRVKTVNMEPARKTVGVGRHRYRLRWASGTEAHRPKPNGHNPTVWVKPATARVGVTLRSSRLTG